MQPSEDLDLRELWCQWWMEQSKLQARMGLKHLVDSCVKPGASEIRQLAKVPANWVFWVRGR